jgi:uncharacterized protein YegL
MASLLSTKNNNTTTKIPETLICPISGTIFKDPVSGPDGYTYERDQIETWLRKNGTSPMTRQPMNISDLVINRTVKDTVEQFLKENTLEGKSDTSEDKTYTASLDAQFNMNICATRFSEENSKVGYIEYSISNMREDNSLKPLDIGVLIDVSGSMSIGVNPNDNSKSENVNVSRLDLTKHAIKSLIRTLPLNTRISLVTFSTSVNVKLDITDGMISNETRRKHFIRIVDSLESESQTMIESGINKIIDVMSKDFRKDRSSVIFVFTDGEPSNEENYVKNCFDIKHNSVKEVIPVHTFGFGYDMKSHLLNYISNRTSGSYSFIPEAGMLATIFNNRLANVLTNIIDQTRVVIDLSSLYQNEITINIDKFQCSYPYALIGSNLIIDIGSLQSDFKKNVCFSFEYNSSKGDVIKAVNQNTKIIIDDVPLEKIIDIATRCERTHAREIFIHFLKNIINKWYEDKEYGLTTDISIFKNKISEIVDDFVQISNSCQHKEDKIYIGGLIKDLNGEVRNSLEKESDFRRWGIHYIPSLLNAHINQVNNNFRDPGVQFYGGEIFRSLRDHAVTQFNSHDIEISRPQNTYSNYRGISSGSRNISRPSQSLRASSQSYNVSSGPCFSPCSKVLMYDNSEKLVSDIEKGDEVYVSNGCKAKVVCVIHNKCFTKYSTFPNGLKITPWHPVLINGEWKFPENIYKSKYEGINESYNFILNSGHMMNINGITCCTLGHGFTDNEVISHEFFGTDDVVKSFYKADSFGFSEGYIDFTNFEFIRSRNSNEVVGIKHIATNILSNWDNKNINSYKMDEKDYTEVINRSVVETY